MNWKFWQRKQAEPEVAAPEPNANFVINEPPVDLNEAQANALHKIKALRNSNACILGVPLRIMTPDQFKKTMTLTMAQVHLGPGYTEDLVDLALTPQETA